MPVIELIVAWAPANAVGAACSPYSIFA
jgi:hypothetical protein